MKKLLATTAIAFVAMAGVASAQAVLERVLGQIDNATNLATVNGTFANIAENIGGSETVYFNGTVTISATAYADLVAADNQADYAVVATGDAVNNTTGAVISATAYAGQSLLEI